MPLPKTYLPEIHDLHPGMTDRLETMRMAFPEAARDHIVYSVVPNWMGEAPVDKNPDFIRLIKSLPGVLALHGWTHSQGSDFVNWLLYGHENRSEFLGRDRPTTEALVDQGLAMFKAAGLPRPRWFCAPRWHPSDSLSDVLFERGFEGNLDGRGLEYAHTTLPVPPLNFDEGERQWKIRPGRVLRAGLIARLMKAERCFRLVLHPDDLDHPKTFAQFQRTVSRLEANGWTPVSLAQLTAEATR